MAADRKTRTVVFKTLENVNLGSIKQAIEKETCHGALTVLQELKPREYLAEFTEKHHAESMIEIGFDLTTTHVDCHPPKGYYTNVSLMGLRAYIADEEIVSVLERYGEIKGPIVRLKYKTGHELAGLENGNRLVKIVLSQPSIPYSLKIDGEWCRVIHSGQQPYCSTCCEFGHNRRNCKDTRCHKCKETGHIAMDCNNEFDTAEAKQESEARRKDETNAQTKKIEENVGNIETPEDANEPMEQTRESDDKHIGADESKARKQTLKRPHVSSTETNTDSENDVDGFKVVTTRRNKIKPTPNLPDAARKTQDKIKVNQKQIKPPTNYSHKNIHGSNK